MTDNNRRLRSQTHEAQPEGHAGPSQQAQVGPEPDALTQSTLGNTPQDTPVLDEEAQLQAELEAERKLLRIAEQRAQIAAACTCRLAIIPPPGNPPPTPTHTTLPATNLLDLQLPKPEAPPRFEGKNRAQLNNWIRGCERYITGSTALSSPSAQVSFAQRYLGNDQIDLWERTLRSAGLDEATATWARMKTVMLDSLGSSWERKQLARERVRNASQRHYTPTELLNYLKTQWEELDDEAALDDRNEDHIHDFYSALDKRIKARLDANPVEWTSLTALEAKANQHHRWVSTNDKDRAPRYTPDHDRPDPRRNKRARFGQFRRSSPPSDNARPARPLPAKVAVDVHLPRQDLSTVECYYCHQKGHYKSDCRKIARDQEAGKDNP
jgi:hypothetical protein